MCRNACVPSKQQWRTCFADKTAAAMVVCYYMAANSAPASVYVLLLLRVLNTEDAVMEPTVLEQLRICLRAKKLQPAEVVGTLSGNYHGYAQVQPWH